MLTLVQLNTWIVYALPAYPRALSSVKFKGLGLLPSTGSFLRLIDGGLWSSNDILTVA